MPGPQRAAWHLLENSKLLQAHASSGCRQLPCHCLQGGWPLPAGGLAAACRGAGRCLQGGWPLPAGGAGRCLQGGWPLPPQPLAATFAQSRLPAQFCLVHARCRLCICLPKWHLAGPKEDQQCHHWAAGKRAPAWTCPNGLLCQHAEAIFRQLSFWS
jgi:hypothetical protein